MRPLCRSQSLSFRFQIDQTFIDSSPRNAEQSAKICEAQKRILETQLARPLQVSPPSCGFAMMSLSFDGFCCSGNRPFWHSGRIQRLTQRRDRTILRYSERLSGLWRLFCGESSRHSAQQNSCFCSDAAAILGNSNALNSVLWHRLASPLVYLARGSFLPARLSPIDLHGTQRGPMDAVHVSQTIRRARGCETLR